MPKDTETDLIPVKIRKSTYRLIKTVAAWRGVTAVDYLDELVQREAGPDLRQMVAEIHQLQAPSGPAVENGEEEGVEEEKPRKKTR